MLSDDPRPLRRACLVTSGGITGYFGQGWDGFPLRCDVAESELPTHAQIREFHGDSPAERSDAIRHALERLHRDERFELIVFAGIGGLGARSIQAKRAGLAFTDVTLAVELDANSQHAREANLRWPSCFAEVETDYLERFAFENADIQCVPDLLLSAFVKRNHWNVRADAVQVLPPPPPHRALPSWATNRDSNSGPLVTVAIAHHNLGAYFPDTLATIAVQTYANIELIAIDDGSTDAKSIEVFEQMRAKYPQWQFLRQENAGIGATRNRCLELANGEFFVPVDADNLACPDMIAKFVTAIKRNPDYAAMSCYFLAFDTDAPNLVPDQFLYALRPLGGPHALAGIRNVYGDANAIFRTEALRAVGGYEIDRGTSCEDWELFVKLVHAGHKLGVVPDHLFYYRHRAGGFSRSTKWFANHQRVLRQFAHAGALPPAEALTLWTALLGFHQAQEHRVTAPAPRRHRFADRVYSALGKPLRWFRK